MKRIFLGTILFLSSVFAIITYAATLPWGIEENVTNGFIVPMAGSKEVTTPEGCRKISGIGVTQAYFAPTKTTTEWNAFKAHLPAGISIGTCIVPINGSCNNSIPLGCGSGSIAASDNGQTACSTTRTWVCKSTTGGADSPLCSKANHICSGTRYPGCNTDDINLSNGQKWAACNVGATTSDVTNVTSYGNYYQWGRNNTGFSEGWSPTDENYWNPGNSNDSQGPCASGYHVPKKEEWCQAINTTIYGTNSSICQNGKINNTSFRNTLKLSPAGYRNISVPYVGALLNNGTYGYYWANSYNDDEVSYNYLNFNNSWLFFDNKGDFAGRGLSVRCVRDTIAVNGTCVLPWGGSIPNGSSVTAYAYNVGYDYAQTCGWGSVTRTCTSGVLSNPTHWWSGAPMIYGSCVSGGECPPGQVPVWCAESGAICGCGYMSAG